MTNVLPAVPVAKDVIYHARIFDARLSSHVPSSHFAGRKSNKIPAFLD
jgi:hypothetical protein